MENFNRNDDDDTANYKVDTIGQYNNYDNNDVDDVNTIKNNDYYDNVNNDYNNNNDSNIIRNSISTASSASSFDRSRNIHPNNNNNNSNISRTTTTTTTIPISNNNNNKSTVINHEMLQSSQINVRTNNNNDEDFDANNIENSNNNQNYHMTIKQIQIVLKNKKLLNYSLHQLSMKKINQLRSKHIISDDDIEDNKFYHSDILHDYEAKDLFYNLPFFIKSPKIKKIYSTLQHIRSLDHMYAKTVKVMMMMIVVISIMIV